MYQPLDGSDDSDDDAKNAGTTTSIRPAAKIEFFEETSTTPYMKLVNEEDME